MKTILLSILLIITFLSFGNSGVYYSHGGQLYPTRENSISIEKEILSFKVVDDKCQVRINFEFYNHEEEEKTLLVGFQAPSAHGDVSDEECNTNQIEKFVIFKDGEILPYKLKIAECPDCDLKEPGEISFSQSKTGVFVFLFKVTFKPGLNKISHSYTFPADHNMELDHIYRYVLTTGAKWKDGVIKELITQIDMGENKYFYMQDVFGLDADWEVVGTGVVTDQEFKYIGNSRYRMLRIISGFLQITVKNFTLTEDIAFGIVHEESFTSWFSDYEKSGPNAAVSIRGLFVSDSRTYSKRELNFMRNAVYAQYGYKFKNKEIYEYFKQFDWYIPNPNLKLSDIHLTIEEQKFVDDILKLEQNLKEDDE